MKQFVPSSDYIFQAAPKIYHNLNFLNCATFARKLNLLILLANFLSRRESFIKKFSRLA